LTLTEGNSAIYALLNSPKRDFSTELRNSTPSALECFSISKTSSKVFPPEVLPYFF